MTNLSAANSSKRKWSIPGDKDPTWANLIGWGFVLGTLIMLFIAVRMQNNGHILILAYSIISGLLVSGCACKVKSKIMLIFGIILLFLYVIAVLIMGVNTP